MQKNFDSRSVKLNDSKIYWFLAPITVLVFIDEWLKYRGLLTLPEEGSVLNPSWIDFVIHKNFGVAFDIPFRLELIIFISIAIGFVLLQTVLKQFRNKPAIAFSACVIIIGALGNLYDRIAYGFTVDYILLFWRSSINLSDIVIISGVVMLLMSSRRRSRKTFVDVPHTHV